MCLCVCFCAQSSCSVELPPITNLFCCRYDSFVALDDVDNAPMAWTSSDISLARVRLDHTWCFADNYTQACHDSELEYFIDANTSDRFQTFTETCSLSKPKPMLCGNETNRPYLMAYGYYLGACFFLLAWPFQVLSHRDYCFVCSFIPKWCHPECH